MQIIHIVITWNEKNANENLDDQGNFYEKVNVFYENVNKVLSELLAMNITLVKKYPLHVSIVSFSINSNMTEDSLINLFFETEFTKSDLKDHLTKNSNVVEKNS